MNRASSWSVLTYDSFKGVSKKSGGLIIVSLKPKLNKTFAILLASQKL